MGTASADVDVLGPALACDAFRALLAAALPVALAVPVRHHVVLLVGDIWQSSLADRRARDAEQTERGEPVPPTSLVLVTNGARSTLHEAARQGVCGFVGDGEPPAQLVQAVQAGARGEPFCSPGLVLHLVRALVGASAAGSDDVLQNLKRGMTAVSDGSGAVARALSRQEREVCLLALSGLSNRDIADRLSVSEATIKSHLCRAYEKLQIHRRAELAFVLKEAKSAYNAPRTTERNVVA